MRKIFSATFIILIFCFLVSPAISCFAEDYPYQRYSAYWRYSVDGVTWTTVSVTPDVTQSDLTFAFPSNIGTNQVMRVQFLLLCYTGSPSESSNYPGISSIDGNISFYTDSYSVDTSNVIIEVANQVYISDSWYVDVVQTISNNGDFHLAPSRQISARLRVDVSNFNIIGFVRPYIRFNSLSINNKDVLADVAQSTATSQFIEESSELSGELIGIDDSIMHQIDSVYDPEEVTDTFDNAYDRFDNYLTEVSDGFINYQVLFAFVNHGSGIMFVLSSAVAMLGLCGYILFGRMG